MIFLSANFQFPMSFRYRFNIRHATDRQTDNSHQCIMSPPYGGGGTISQCLRFRSVLCIRSADRNKASSASWVIAKQIWPTASDDIWRPGHVPRRSGSISASRRLSKSQPLPTSRRLHLYNETSEPRGWRHKSTTSHIDYCIPSEDAHVMSRTHSNRAVKNTASAPRNCAIWLIDRRRRLLVNKNY